MDFAYPKSKLIIEADGYRHHSGRMAWQRDRIRGNALTSRGRLVLRVTWDDVTTRPGQFVAEIRRCLDVRKVGGWGTRRPRDVV